MLLFFSRERSGACTNQASGRRQQVFNASATAWCVDVEHNGSALSCDPGWVKDQQCCDTCGDHPWGISNICMDDVAFVAPEPFEL